MNATEVIHETMRDTVVVLVQGTPLERSAFFARVADDPSPLMADALEWSLSQVDDFAIRTQVVRALADHPGPDTLRVFQGRLVPGEGFERHPIARAAVAEVLGRLGNALTLPVLFEAVKDEDPDVRGEAIESLGRLTRRVLDEKTNTNALLKDVFPALGIAVPQQERNDTPVSFRTRVEKALVTKVSILLFPVSGWSPSIKGDTYLSVRARADAALDTIDPEILTKYKSKVRKADESVYKLD